MFEIVKSQALSSDVKRFEIRAPRIAQKWRAGQFVIVRPHEFGERIPLTIAGVDLDAQDGATITLIIQALGKTTKLLNLLEAGDVILDIVGPLGKASEIEKYGTVVMIGGGVGTAIAYPTAVAMKNVGNHVISIVGARTQQLLILEDEMRATSDELFIMTDDGSYGEKGFVTTKLQQLIDDRDIDLVTAIGPVPMMRAVADLTKPHNIKTIVSLNPIMVDGTGMCGGCRVLINGQSKFACVDGPEFDAHTVDFDVLIKRNNLYRDLEADATKRFENDSQHDLQRMADNQECGGGRCCHKNNS